MRIAVRFRNEKRLYARGLLEIIYFCSYIYNFVFSFG